MAPQSDDEVVDLPCVGVLTQSPDVLEDRFTRHRASVAAKQVTKKIRFHEGQPDRVAVRTKFEVAEIDCLATKGNDQMAGTGRRNHPGAIDSPRFRALPAAATQPCSSPQQTLESRQEYPQFERLRKIVVSSRFKTLQHVSGAAPSRQYENGDIVLGFAKRGSNGESVHAREHHV